MRLPDAKGWVGDGVDNGSQRSAKGQTGGGGGASVPVHGAEPGETGLLSTPHRHPQEKEETAKGERKKRWGRHMETPGDVAREKEGMF